jgi:hypothetical protein
MLGYETAQRAWRAALPCLLLAAMMAWAAPVAAFGPPAPTEEEQALEEVTQPFGGPEGEDETVTDGEAGPGPAPEPLDECDWKLEGEKLPEQTREVARSWSCHSFRWFDSWWGDKYDFDEKAVNGLVTFGARYTEFYGLDQKLRIKVRAPLPNLSSRWDLILGRVDEEAFVTDTQGQDRTFYNPGAIDRGEDDAWLLGLGHRGNARKRGWDYSVGVRLRWPPEPYVKAQWYYNKEFSERSDFRFRQTFFWRSDRGFGTTSRGDMAYGIDEKNVLRWEAFGTVHDKVQGVQWYAGQTWYHLFGGRNALSLRGFIRGETDDDVPLKEYGLDVIWRRPFTREWLYLSAGPSVTWPKEELTDERDMSLGFNLWLEMEFGNWRY